LRFGQPENGGLCITLGYRPSPLKLPLRVRLHARKQLGS
jgi:hypothetical protein